MNSNFKPDVIKTNSIVYDSTEDAIKDLTAKGLVIGTGPFKNRVYKKTETGLKLIGKLNQRKK